MTLPDLPPGWQAAFAAAGAILVIFWVLKWTGDIMKGQGDQSKTLIDRSYDVVDQIVEHGVKLQADEPPPPPEELRLPG